MRIPPPIYDRQAEPVMWLNHYVTTYVEREIRLMSDIQNNEAFIQFMRARALPANC
jgi:hypothetical protein